MLDTAKIPAATRNGSPAPAPAMFSPAEKVNASRGASVNPPTELTRDIVLYKAAICALSTRDVSHNCTDWSNPQPSV
jgi:hypothetical protein